MSNNNEQDAKKTFWNFVNKGLDSSAYDAVGILTESLPHTDCSIINLVEAISLYRDEVLSMKQTVGDAISANLQRIDAAFGDLMQEEGMDGSARAVLNSIFLSEWLRAKTLAYLLDDSANVLALTGLIEAAHGVKPAQLSLDLKVREVRATEDALQGSGLKLDAIPLGLRMEDHESISTDTLTDFLSGRRAFGSSLLNYVENNALDDVISSVKMSKALYDEMLSQEAAADLVESTNEGGIA